MEILKLNNEPKYTRLKTVLILLICLLGVSTSFGINEPLLRNEIINKIKLDFNEVELDKYHQDFVAISFTIVNGKIQIVEANSSQLEL